MSVLSCRQAGGRLRRRNQGAEIEDRLPFPADRQQRQDLACQWAQAAAERVERHVAAMDGPDRAGKLQRDDVPGWREGAHRLRHRLRSVAGDILDPVVELAGIIEQGREGSLPDGADIRARDMPEIEELHTADRTWLRGKARGQTGEGWPLDLVDALARG